MSKNVVLIDQILKHTKKMRLKNNATTPLVRMTMFDLGGLACTVGLTWVIFMHFSKFRDSKMMVIA